MRIASDVAEGVNYMHTRNPPILHMDLKSPNILLASLSPSAPVVAKLADFGLSGCLPTLGG